MTKVPVSLRRMQPQIAALLRLLTMVVGPVTRGLSPLFGSRGVPTRAAPSMMAYAFDHAPHGAGIEIVRDTEHVKREIPPGLPPDHRRFVEDTEHELPEKGVFDLPEGRVFGDLGAVITPDRTILLDVSRDYFAARRPTTHPIFRRLRLPPPERVDGSVAVLATRADHNYYHFMLDALPRLGLLEQTRPLGALDGFVVRASQPFQRELLELCGVPTDRIIDSTMHRHVQARRLVVPSIPALLGQTPRWVVEFLRDRLMVPGSLSGGRPTRIYVSRGARRRTRAVANETAVIEMLAPHGIVPVTLDAMPVREQIELFRAAELIVAPHGAGITNAVFCRPGTRLVEVLSPRYVNTCFYNLCSQVEGIDYTYILGAGTPPPPEHDLKGVSADITVDLDRLAAVLERPRT